MTTSYTPAAVLRAHTTAAFDAIIERMEQECGEAGDLAGVATCRRALAGSSRARRTVAGWVACAADRRDNG
jgi:hypothetical protein